ncbi:MAG: hypothetical protein RIF33_04920 [Cyclobacteriaceae bacterium]
MELEEYINLRREEVTTEAYDFIIDFLIEDENQPQLERLWDAMEYQIMDVDIAQQIWKSITDQAEKEPGQNSFSDVKQRVA